MFREVVRCVKVYPTVKYHDRVSQTVRHIMQTLFAYGCLRPLSDFGEKF